jgi:ubiquinone/menaquinone biosynthesis C-methylase UbiE
LRLTNSDQRLEAGGRPSHSSFPRYLAAKKSVDDRALNRRVWETLGQSLPGGRPLDFLEVGAGIGTMLERMLDWRLLSDACYTGIDAQAENIAAAQERLAGYSRQRGFALGKPSGGPEGGQRLERPPA